MLQSRFRIAALVLFPFIAFLTYVGYVHHDKIAEHSTRISSNLKSNLNEGLDSWLKGDEAERHGLDLSDGLMSWMNYSLDASDFARKGDRVNAIAGLMGIVKEHPTNDLIERLVTVLEGEYPWWMPDEDAYLPWEKTWFYRPKGKETGIVISTDSDTFLSAAQTIAILRNVLGSKLPIEFAYAGNTNLSPEHQTYLQELGPNIRPIDIHGHFDEKAVGHLSGSSDAIKPFAILASRFQRVILLDASTVFLQSPDNILDLHSSYNSTGLLLYHDRAYHQENSSRRDWIAEKLHFRNLTTQLTTGLFWHKDLLSEMTPAVVGVDKSHIPAFMTTLFAAWMSTKEVLDKESYHHEVLGDKETFWLAAEFARLPYDFVPEYAGTIGFLHSSSSNTSSNLSSDSKNKVCGPRILHINPSSRKPFWLSNGGNTTIGNGSQISPPSASNLKDLTTYVLPTDPILEVPRLLSWEYLNNESEGEWCDDGAAGEIQEISSFASNATDSKAGSGTEGAVEGEEGMNQILRSIAIQSDDVVKDLESKGIGLSIR